MFGEKPRWKRVRSKPPVLETGESVEATWFACIPFEAFNGRASRTGGTLILTNTRLWFVPLGIDWKAPPHTAGIGTAVKSFIKSEVGQARLTEISKVASVPGKMPRLRISSISGAEATFGVFIRRLSTMLGTPDPSARDEAVQRISAAVRRAAASDS